MSDDIIASDFIVSAAHNSAIVEILRKHPQLKDEWAFVIRELTSEKHWADLEDSKLQATFPIWILKTLDTWVRNSDSKFSILVDCILKYHAKASEELKAQTSDIVRVQSEPHISLLKKKWWPQKKNLINSFVPRKHGDKTVIEKLKAVLNQKNVNNAVLTQKASMTGMGGIGKTTIAKWYANEYENEYDNIIWIDCGEGNITKSLKELANTSKIELTDSEKHPKNIELIVQEIYEQFKSIRCLLIFDNVDEFKEVKNVLPQENHCHHSLLTSRFQYWGNENELGAITVFKLDLFSSQEADDLLVKTLNSKDKEDVDMRRKLAEKTGNLPLALQIAVVTINNLGWMVEEYIRQLNDQPEVLLTEEKLDYYQKTIFKTLGVSIAAIEGEELHGPSAAEILSLLAFVQPQNIQHEMLARFEKDQFKLASALHLLEKYSLIDKILNKNKLLYNIHRLLQDVIRIRMNDAGTISVLRNLLKEVCDHPNEPQFHRSHTYSVWNHAMKEPKLIEEFKECFAYIVEEWANDYIGYASNDLLKCALPHLDRIFGFRHERTFQTRAALAYVHFRAGRYDESCKLWEEIQKAVTVSWWWTLFRLSYIFPTSIDDDERFTVLNIIKYNLGVLHENQGKYLDAAVFYNSIVENNWEVIVLLNTIVIKFGATIHETTILSNLLEMDKECRESQISRVSPVSIEVQTARTYYNPGYFNQYDPWLAGPFPSELKIILRCKIVLLTANSLPKAWKHMQILMADKITRYEDSLDFIVIAGLKLLHSIYNEKNETQERLYKLESERLCTYLLQHFVNWGRQVPLWLKILYWNSVAELVDSIALALIEFRLLSKVTKLYKNLHHAQKCINFLEIEASEFKFSNMGLNVVPLVNKLGESSMAYEIEKTISAIKKLGGDANWLVTNCRDRESHGICKRKLLSVPRRKRIQLNAASMNDIPLYIQKNYLTEILFTNSDLYKHDLVQALDECSQLKSLILLRVKIIGGCKQRSYLPHLKEFVIELRGTDPMFWDICKFDYGLKPLLNSLSFFHKSTNHRDWSIENFSCLKLSRYKVAHGTETKIEVNKQDRSVVYGFDDVVAEQFLRSLDFEPAKLILTDCIVSMRVILDYANTLKHIALHNVSFRGSMNMELCETLLHHFPHLEILDVIASANGSQCLSINYLPKKLTQLRLASIKLIYSNNKCEQIIPITNQLPRLKSIHLENIPIPTDETQIHQLFPSSCETVCMTLSNSHDLSTVNKFVQMSSIILICIHWKYRFPSQLVFDTEMEWLSEIGVPAGYSDFCIRRKGMGNG